MLVSIFRSIHDSYFNVSQLFSVGCVHLSLRYCALGSYYRVLLYCLHFYRVSLIGLCCNRLICCCKTLELLTFLCTYHLFLFRQNSSLPTNAPFIKHRMLKFTLKYPTFAPTCFGPSGPSSGSLPRAWLKSQFCRINQ